MRFNRMVDQRQRLRDLMSEVQDNHTDIQRLWKSIAAGGIVWPVGIAAAPPIEEEESGSCEDVCAGCNRKPGDSLTLTMTSSGVGDGPYGVFEKFLGSNTLNYVTSSPSTHGGSDRYLFWETECKFINASESYYSGTYENKYAKFYMACRICTETKYILVGVSNPFESSGDCTSSTYPSAINTALWSSTTFNCDPLHVVEGPNGRYSIEITE